MATTTTKKRKSVGTQLKKVTPALGDLGGAMTGGMLGAIAPPMVSGVGGVLLLGLGAYSQKSWVTSTGAAMLVTTVASGQANQRMSPTGKFDAKTEAYNAKQRLKTFGQGFIAKFKIKRKPALPADSVDEANLDGLGSLDRAHLSALDELNHSIVSQGLRQAGKSYPMVYQGQQTIY
jgi:hypothetical protein